MKRLFIALILALTLSSCMSPTTRRPRIPTVGSYDMEKIRRQMTRYSQNYLAERRARVQGIGYNVLSHAGQELCDRKLVTDIGVEFMKITKFNANKYFNPNYKILETEHKDVSKVFGKRAEKIWIQSVYKGSAADKAGIKSGDLLISYNGVNAPTGKKAFEQLFETMRRTSNDGLPVQVVVERKDKEMTFEFEPDMVCPYYVYIDESMRTINAYADGENLYLSAELIDYMQDDTALAAVISHELAHNVLGHREAKTTNIAVGMLAGAVVDIVARGNGTATISGANAGAMMYSKEFEMEADYVSVYFMARAGYDYKSMGIVQKMFAARDYWSIYLDGTTHPTPSARYALIDETIKEIEIKKVFNEDLLPDFNTTNKYLKNKKDTTRGKSLW